MRLLPDCTVEYVFLTPIGGESLPWIWDIKRRKWTPPPGSEPNPWTPEGVPLAGPGTF